MRRVGVGKGEAEMGFRAEIQAQEQLHGGEQRLESAVAHQDLRSYRVGRPP